MITIDGNNAPMSFKDTMNYLCRHRMYKTNIKYMLMYRENESEEWIPYGLFETRPIAEFFEKRLNHDFSRTCIISVDNYKIPIFSHGVHHV